MNFENNILSNVWAKNCPKCGDEQIYTNKGALKKSISENRWCNKCRRESRKIIVPPNGWMKTCSKCGCEMYYSNIHALQRAIINNTVCRRGNCKIPMNGWRKPCPMCNKEIIYKTKWDYTQSMKNNTLCRKCCHKGRILSDETIKKKYYDALARTKWLKVRSDIGQLELLNKWNNIGFDFEANYQLKLDGGLYYLDGYDKKHNVVIEYDSKYHDRFRQQEIDLVRQNKIIEILNPKKFWRYNAVTKKFRNVLEDVR